MSRRSCMSVCSRIVSKRNVSFNGVFPPIATPFSEDGSQIDFKALEYNLGKLRQSPLSGYVVMGSTGEYLSLTHSESCSLVEAVVSVSQSQKRLVIAGAGRESTDQTIRLCKEYARLGADCVLIVTPHYYSNQYGDEEFVQHFTSVADKSPIPVLLYNVPGCTHIDLSVSAIVTLSKHPNIVGMKESGGDLKKIEQIIEKTSGEKFDIIAGSAGFFLPALKLGAVGCVPGLGNVLPGEVCQLHQEYLGGNESQTQSIHESIQAPNSGVTRQFGVPGVKCAMDWFGFKSGLPRRPLLPLTQEKQSTLRQIFQPFLQDSQT